MGSTSDAMPDADERFAHCRSGDVLRLVSPDGTTSDVACAWGCLDDGGAHCGTAIPAGGAVIPADLDPSGMLADVSLTPPMTTIDTSTGAITNLRPAGIGNLAGIEFVVRNNVGVFRVGRLSITGDVSVRGGNAFALVATSDITITGVVDARGTCANVDAGPGGGRGGDSEQPGAGPGGGAAGQGNNEDGGAGGAGGGHGARGGDGAPGANAPATAGGAVYGDVGISMLAGGSGGGGGGSSVGGHGGGGGGAVQLVTNGTITIGAGGINAGGCGAGSDRDGGGGGGGAGGAILLEAPTIVLNPGAVLAVNGGAGGGAAAANAAGMHGALSAMPSSGGQSTAGDGGDGGAGTMVMGATGEIVSNPSEGGGGGGGAVGRIRLNTKSGEASIDTSAVLSPSLAAVPACSSQGAVTVR